MDMIELTDSTFAELATGAELPVLVEFSARWCGPCRMLAPVLHELANEQSEQLRVAQIDVDENPEATRRYDVMSMPTLGPFRRRKRSDAARQRQELREANLMQEIAVHRRLAPAARRRTRTRMYR